MNEVFTFGSLAGHYVAFLLFVLMAIGVGFAVVRLAAKGASSGYQGREGTPAYSAAIGILVAGTLLAVVCTGYGVDFTPWKLAKGVSFCNTRCRSGNACL